MMIGKKKKKEMEQDQEDLLKKQEESNNESANPNGEVQADVASTGEEAAKLVTETEDKAKQVAELNDKYLRLYAEFDNYRRRTQRERIDLIQSASAELMVSLLPVLDDFDRAVKAFDQSLEGAPLKEGLVLVQQKFKSILAQKGLEEMKSMGEPFDTDLHEAVANIPVDTEENKGKVIEEIEKGYFLNGKVIRFAKVIVAN